MGKFDKGKPIRPDELEVFGGWTEIDLDSLKKKISDTFQNGPVVRERFDLKDEKYQRKSVTACSYLGLMVDKGGQGSLAWQDDQKEEMRYFPVNSEKVAVATYRDEKDRRGVMLMKWTSDKSGRAHLVRVSERVWGEKIGG